MNSGDALRLTFKRDGICVRLVSIVRLYVAHGPDSDDRDNHSCVRFRAKALSSRVASFESMIFSEHSCAKMQYQDELNFLVYEASDHRHRGCSSGRRGECVSVRVTCSSALTDEPFQFQLRRQINALSALIVVAGHDLVGDA